MFEKVDQLLRAIDLKPRLSWAIAVSSGLIFLLIKLDRPELRESVTPSQGWIVVIFITSASLALSFSVVALWRRVSELWETLKARRVVLDHLNFVTDEERAALSFLVQTGTRIFTTKARPPELMTLRNKGLIEMCRGHGGYLLAAHFVPGFVWKALLLRKAEFDTANRSNGTPWFNVDHGF